MLQHLPWNTKVIRPFSRQHTFSNILIGKQSWFFLQLFPAFVTTSLTISNASIICETTSGEIESSMKIILDMFCFERSFFFYLWLKMIFKLKLKRLDIWILFWRNWIYFFLKRLEKKNKGYLKNYRKNVQI